MWWPTPVIDPSSQPVEAEGLGVQGHPQLHSEFKTIVGYMRSCLWRLSIQQKQFLPTLLLEKWLPWVLLLSRKNTGPCCTHDTYRTKLFQASEHVRMAVVSLSCNKASLPLRKEAWDSSHTSSNEPDTVASLLLGSLSGLKAHFRWLCCGEFWACQIRCFSKVPFVEL